MNTNEKFYQSAISVSVGDKVKAQGVEGIVKSFTYSTDEDVDLTIETDSSTLRIVRCADSESVEMLSHSWECVCDTCNGMFI